jgi:hypothetical protein
VAPVPTEPQLPPEGMDQRAYRTAKFGSWERSLELDARPAEVGAGGRMAFAFAKGTRTPDTRDAHRLIRLAGEAGVLDAAAAAMFRAYFSEGHDIGDRRTLLGVAAGAGLDWNLAEAELTGGAGLGRSGPERAAPLGHPRDERGRHDRRRPRVAGGGPVTVVGERPVSLDDRNRGLAASPGGLGAGSGVTGAGKQDPAHTLTGPAN